MTPSKNSSTPTLAVAIIAKNEAKNLKECLSTVADWVDEIVILDSGSTDTTLEIAESFNAKVFSNTEWSGFGRQRQIAQSHVNADYVLWLDADERVTKELRESIVEAVKANKPNAVYTICRLSWVFGRFIRHSGWYPDRVVRLYPTQLTSYNEALVHEKVIVTKEMETLTLTGDALHYTYDDLNHYLTKSAGYARAWAQERAENGKSASLSKGVVHAIACFIKMYLLKRGFLDGKQGLLLALLSSHSTFVKYADLWIRTKTAHSKH